MSLNSSLGPWINFNLNHIWDDGASTPSLKPCSVNGSAVNCSDICVGQYDNTNMDGAIVWDPSAPTNLVNCGLYYTIGVFINYYGLGIDASNEMPPWTSPLISPFNSVGLSWPARGYPTSRIPDFNCFQYVWAMENRPYTDAQTVSSPCGIDTLFGWQAMSLSSAPIGYCLEEICAPKGLLNPDLGGIGVSISFIMQSSIAILGFCGLLLAEWRSSVHGNNVRSHPRKHLDTLTTALVEFQKSQCYFSAAVQIAAIVFAFDLLHWRSTDLTSGGMLFIIATCGSVPVVFNLTAIRRYGQQSWYLIFLSFCCLGLSLTTLICNYFEFLPRHVRPEDYDLVYLNRCGMHDKKDLIRSWCESNVQYPVRTDLKIIGSGWNWGLWSICAVWFLYCAVEKILGSGPTTTGKIGRSLRLTVGWLAVWRNPMFQNTVMTQILHALFLISWAFAFGYQLYLYSIPFTHAQVAQTWGFGQIVAITVWAPCLAEYIYLERDGMFEGSRYRLPKGFIVSRVHHTPANGLASPDEDTQGLVNANTPELKKKYPVSPNRSLRSQNRGSDIELDLLVHDEHGAPAA